MGGWPEDFFATTPRLYLAVVEGRTNAERRRFRLAAWHAHTSATLERAKRIPLLQRLIGGPDIDNTGTVRRAPSDLLSIARRWQDALVKKGPNGAG
jgi:hypothetical protein